MGYFPIPGETTSIPRNISRKAAKTGRRDYVRKPGALRWFLVPRGKRTEEIGHVCESCLAAVSMGCVFAVVEHDGRCRRNFALDRFDLLGCAIFVLNSLKHEDRAADCIQERLDIPVA